LDDNAAKEFCKFMVQLHSCPCSSAGIERWFSTVGFIWSKIRNRLGADKAKKLATVYRALRPSPKDKVAHKDFTSSEGAAGDGVGVRVNNNLEPQQREAPESLTSESDNDDDDVGWPVFSDSEL